MAILDPIDTGTTPNDGTGDVLRDAFNKTNTNDIAINDELGTLSNKTKSATSGTLTAGSNIITFSSPFTDTNYNLTLTVLDASGVPSAYTLTAKTASNFTIDLAFDSIVTYIAHKN
jgi:hypothetical protein